MSETLSKAITAITAQQGEKRTAVWMCGEQLKEIITREPDNAELVVQDLTVGGMKLSECEKRIHALADKHKTGNFSCVTQAEAEEIIRAYFGIGPSEDGIHAGSAETLDPTTASGPPSPQQGTKGRRGQKIIDLEDFF